MQRFRIALWLAAGIAGVFNHSTVYGTADRRAGRLFNGVDNPHWLGGSSRSEPVVFAPLRYRNADSFLAN